MKKSEAATLRKKIEAYRQAAIADSWAGTSGQNNYEALAEEFNTAEKKLNDYIDSKTAEGAVAEKAIEQLKLLATVRGDTEAAHIDADEVLCSLLKKLGYGKVVEAFNRITKWYA